MRAGVENADEPASPGAELLAAEHAVGDLEELEPESVELSQEKEKVVDVLQAPLGQQPLRAAPVARGERPKLRRAPTSGGLCEGVAKQVGERCEVAAEEISVVIHQLLDTGVLRPRGPHPHALFP